MSKGAQNDRGSSLRGSVRLIPAQRSHAEFWYRIRNEPRSLRFNPVNDASISQLADRLGRCRSDFTNTSGPEYRWMLQDESGTLVGTASATVNWRMRHAEIGYQIAEAYYGRGYAKAAVTNLLNLAFAETSRLMRVFASIHCENAASIAVVERLGFTHEGTLRDHYRIQNEYVTELIYGMLRREWQVPARDA